MKIAIFAAVAASAIALSGCTGFGNFLTTTQTDDSVGARVLADIQGCDRDYQGSIGPTSVQGSFHIKCAPAAPAPVTIGQPIGAGGTFGGGGATTITPNN